MPQLPPASATYRNGVLDGPVRHYGPDRRLRTERWYRDGRPHGPWRSWYENGRLAEEEIFVDGRRVSHLAWTTTGQPISSVEAKHTRQPRAIDGEAGDTRTSDARHRDGDVGH
ncbi:hypothetical protein C3Y87_20795 [Carbonactinospora thermoautotrophica]|nr:hypothetical protein [Carbonactinospora thermoautotrophica]